uniref:Putative secreted metalloprotease n=1 Tax=Amblyomma tuberculatum TaxID=48802 RepID=A0A6M2E5N4_9ACAR
MRITLFVLLFGGYATAAEHPSVVFPRLLEERADTGAKTVRIHDKLTLSLQKASVAAKNFRVRRVVDGRTVTTFVDGAHIEKSLYDDAEKLATMSVTIEDGRVLLNGLIGPSHRIVPIPGSERSEDGEIPHAIHKVEAKIYDKEVLGQSAKAALNGVTERADSLPSEVLIEVFLVSDSKHNVVFATFQDLATYLCVCINSVNLRYKQSRDPNFRLLLTGIEKSEEEPYNAGNENNMYDDGTIEKFKKHAKSHVGDYGYADVVFLLTGRELFTVMGNAINNAVTGIAFMAGVCTAEFVGIGEEKPGSYDVIHTFAHEVAHLLGASHDGDRPVRSMPNRPGSEACPWEDGYMMSYIDGGAKHQRLSSCSLEQIKFVLLLRGISCWGTGSGNEYVVEDAFPGQFLTDKAYCRRMFPTLTSIYPNTTHTLSSKCKMKCCYDSMIFSTTTCFTVDIPDYMSCGYEKVCFVGDCLSKAYIRSLP